MERDLLSKQSLSKVAPAALFLIAIVWIVYSPALHGAFLWDDDLLIKKPSTFHDIWFGHVSDYWPVSLSMFRIERLLFGEHRLGYHCVNILLHSGNVLFVWFILRQLKVPGAWLGAALFAVHPVCVASVAWISELKNSLSLFFALLAVYQYLHWSECRKNRWYWLALAMFAIAMLSKSSVAFVPVVFLLVGWYRKEPFRACFVRTLPFFAVGAALALLGLASQKNVLGDYAGMTGSLTERVAIGGRAIWFYAEKVIAPVGLSMLYPRWHIEPRHWLAFVPWCLWLGLLGALWFWRARTWARACLLALLYYTLALLPALGFVNLVYFVDAQVGDHMQYAAMIGLLALIAAGLTILTRDYPEVWRRLGVGVLLAVLAMLTVEQSNVFASEERVWAQASKINPESPVAAFNLAVAEDNAHKPDLALKYYFLSIQLNTNQPVVLNSLLVRGYCNAGDILAKAGRYQQTLDTYEKLLSRDSVLREDKQLVPMLNKAQYAAANLLVQSGRDDDAIAAYKKLLDLEPGFTKAEGNLAFVLLKENKSAEAIPHLRKVLAATPDNLNANLNLSRALLSEHQPLEANKYLGIVARMLRPNDPLQAEVQRLNTQIEDSLKAKTGTN